MNLLFMIILASYFLICFITYAYLYKIRNLISYHFGMNLAMSSGGVMGIAVGTILGSLVPAHYTVITIIATVVGIVIGALFGALVDYQSLLTGVSSGLMAGVMGPMIGVMASDMGMIAFCTILVYLTFGLLCFSIRS